MYCRNCHKLLKPEEAKRVSHDTRVLWVILVTAGGFCLVTALMGAPLPGSLFTGVFGAAIAAGLVFGPGEDIDFLRRYVCPVCLLPLSHEHPSQSDSPAGKLCVRCSHMNDTGATYCARCGCSLNDGGEAKGEP